ncbi:MAG: dTDP-4-dehydrorhamnose 3,5-epimerase [Lachnospiraceae bacterium]|nr:dTDP-4-dehydrorhamnose 3,5-epimerase [Lachnospiraceae bacterium]
MDFNIQDLPLQGAKLISPFYIQDERGYFQKNYEKDIFEQWDLCTDIYESFESSSKRGVIRGLHFQTLKPQSKIVRVIRGTVRDVIVDLRKDSETFGKYIDVILSDKNHLSLWVPKGFAHGFEVLSEEAITSYICIGKYLKSYDSGIRWNDKELNIKWETKYPIVSDRDSRLMSFREYKENYNESW